MPRLTILTTSLARGGAEAQVVLLARSLRARGWRVEVISMLQPESHAEDLARAGIPVHSLRMRGGVPDPRAIFRLAGLLRQSNPHVLHCHMVHANLLGRAVRLLVSVPVVICTAHSVREGPRWLEWGYRITDSLCDLTTNVCRAGVEQYRRAGAVPHGKITFVPNGLDGNAYARTAVARREVRAKLGLNGHFAWLAIGNLRKAKDYPMMFQALAALANHPREHRLLIAGVGVLEEELRNLVVQWNLSSRVHWLGGRTDVSHLTSAADAFVMSSSIEGTPMALLEAAAGELPAVATRVGGIPDVVKDQCTGYLVSPGDVPALAGAMDRLMRLSENELLNMGRAARQRVLSTHDIQTVVAEWDGIYKQLLREGCWSPALHESCQTSAACKISAHFPGSVKAEGINACQVKLTILRSHWMMFVAASAACLGMAYLISEPALPGFIEDSGINIPTSDILRDYGDGILWACVLFIFVLAWPVRREHKKMLATGWLVKCLVALVLMLPYERQYWGLDCWTYFQRAHSGVGGMLAGAGNNGSNIVTGLGALHLQIGPDSYHAMKLSFAMVGFIAVYLFYRAAEVLLDATLHLFFGYFYFTRAFSSGLP